MPRRGRPSLHVRPGPVGSAAEPAREPEDRVTAGSTGPPTSDLAAFPLAAPGLGRAPPPQNLLFPWNTRRGPGWGSALGQRPCRWLLGACRFTRVGPGGSGQAPGQGWWDPGGPAASPAYPRGAGGQSRKPQKSLGSRADPAWSPGDSPGGLGRVRRLHGTPPPGRRGVGCPVCSGFHCRGPRPCPAWQLSPCSDVLSWNYSDFQHLVFNCGKIYKTHSRSALHVHGPLPPHHPPGAPLPHKGWGCSMDRGSSVPARPLVWYMATEPSAVVFAQTELFTFQTLPAPPGATWACPSWVQRQEARLSLKP